MRSSSAQVLLLFGLCCAMLKPGCPLYAQTQGSTNAKASKAIDQALDYFGSKRGALDPDAALFYMYLQAHYKLPELITYEGFVAMAEGDSMKLRMAAPFLRIAAPVQFKPEFLEPRRGVVDNITICGIWYDHLPQKELLHDRIAALDLDAPYSVTHALLALAIAQKCHGAQADSALEQRLQQRNTRIMESARPLWGDVHIEALAMAQFSDPRYIPPAAYIEEVIALQNENGSWNANPDEQGDGSQHTTLLGLWALLQYPPLATPCAPRPFVLRQ